jgi:uncharacterized Fe-S cluster protein YjdI
MREADPVTTEPAGKAYQGNGVVVYFDATRCRHFGECLRGLPTVFNASEKPWIRPDQDDADAVAEVVGRCPSGALHYVIPGGPGEVGVSPTQLQPLAGGPVLVRGDLVLETTAGPVRETRMALCACGRSTNSPFCDGACQTPA